MRIAPLALCACVGGLVGCGSAAPAAPPRPSKTPPLSNSQSTSSTQSTSRTRIPPRTKLPPPQRTHARPTAIETRVVTFVDHSRTVDVHGSRLPRRLVTVIRYPAGAAGPLPLVLFGHGFAVTPAPYAPLLQAWARAGYVVAAPVFPLENAHAPGGPNEADLVNQPGDVSFVISELLRLSRRHTGFLAGRLDPRRIAVSGQSDGGETALAVAYDTHYVDHRISAAVILSGAEIPGVGGFTFPAPSPPLLATQGTGDTINPPSFTNAFFDIAPRPKFLLSLLGASHLGPYTGVEPQTRVVERVTIAFLDRYLKGERGALKRMAAAGDRRGIARLALEP